MRSPMHSTVCASSSESRCSKSNIKPCRSLEDPGASRLPVTVGAVEEPRDVTLDGIRQGGERLSISGAPQIFDFRLREILIAVANADRHIDILDIGCAPQRREHGSDQIAKARRLAGAGIVDSR